MQSSIIWREKKVYLSDLAKEVEPRVTYSTAWQWWRLGRVNRHTGERVKLEAVRLSGGLATSFEAYERFLMALNS